MQYDISKYTFIKPVILQKIIFYEMTGGNINFIISLRHQNKFGKHKFKINFYEYVMFFLSIFNIFIDTNKDPNNERIVHIT